MPKYSYLTAKGKAFINNYCGKARFNSVAAAKLAGYASPEVSGPRLKRKYSKQLDKRFEELAKEAQMGAQEVLQELTTIARSKERKDLQARLRALELLAKIHGLSSEKVSIKVDRATVLSELDAALEQLAGLQKKAPPDKPSTVN